MNKTENTRFSELVKKRLMSEEQARQLWMPIADEFDRSGPDVARELLDAERQRLEERVQNLLNQFERR